MSTRKRQSPLAINGKLIEETKGWKKIHIYGEPFERGYAHGVLLFKELKRVKDTLKFMVQSSLKLDMPEYMKQCNKTIYPIIKSKYPEFFRELEGISAGAKRKGTIMSVEYLIAWNSILSISENENKAARCSAFIATGDATKNGDIVMAHNTHCDFLTGQLSNIIMTVTPSTGGEFTMQTLPGYIASATDFFVCVNGIIGCETTIAGFLPKPRFGAPYFCRIRQAMQYANTLDDCCRIMIEDNAGDYANSWLFGDINTNEILMLELGLDTHKISRTTNGVYYGMNSAIDLRLRYLETNDNSHDDLTTSVGARNSRLDYLLNDKYYGKLDIRTAKLVMSDHYDSMLNKNVMSSRNICKHCELDETCEYKPKGCVDAKVTNSNMARTMSFYGRFGSGCGRAFKVAPFIRAHPEHKKWAAVLKDIPKFEWTKL